MPINYIYYICNIHFECPFYGHITANIVIGDKVSIMCVTIKKISFRSLIFWFSWTLKIHENRLVEYIGKLIRFWTIYNIFIQMLNGEFFHFIALLMEWNSELVYAI